MSIVALNLRGLSLWLRPAGGLSGIASNFSITPNPARDAFVLSLDLAGFEEGSLTIRNLKGQVVGIETITQSETFVKIDQLKPGIYLLQIEINETRFIRRLIKY